MRYRDYYLAGMTIERDPMGYRLQTRLHRLKIAHLLDG